MHLKLLKKSRAWIFMLRAWTKHASLVTLNPKPLVELLKRKNSPIQMEIKALGCYGLLLYGARFMKKESF